MNEKKMERNFPQTNIARYNKYFLPLSLFFFTFPT